ncbi:hypothetical protein OFY17_12155 [Marinomonas sp. C2222]|uniref:YtkA-like domain-containing protein n=1 Tax=Marinomonas sargassi TaxID=2984494 RepID=A0ABT2YV34_9GAMM|nr:hypothetical protein [Marinomonas sargassi]MCV2403625.1 hypothetical protein [Marinomonas sargassi]
MPWTQLSRAVFLRAVLWLLSLVVTNTVMACTLPAGSDINRQEGEFLISVQFDKQPLELGALHSIQAIICYASGQAYTGEIKADAIMPAHNHGMNYQPSFTMTSPGHYTGTGFVFHMPGLWRLRLTLQSDNGKQLIEHDFVL